MRNDSTPTENSILKQNVDSANIYAQCHNEGDL